MNSNVPGQPDVDGSQALQSVVTDLNPGQRGAEVALAESERRYRDLVETSYDLIWAVDETGRITYLNQACRKIYGREPEEMTGRMFLEFVPPEQYEKDVAASSEAIRTGKQTVDYTSRIYHADGSIVILITNAVIMRDENGRMIGSTGIARDMTKSILAKETLRKSETLLRIAGKAARLGGWTLELPEYKLTWSEETCILHDLPPGHQPTFEEGISMFPPESRAEVARCVEACAREGKSYDFEVPKITATGRRIWVRSIGEAVRDADGKIVRLQGAFQDITERKKLQSNLLRAQRLESIGTLAGGIAHDLNNVLAPILMSVTLLKAKMADTESERLLHTLQKSAQRGADLVKQVLSFARGVEGQRIEVNPAQLLRETFPKSIVVELTAKRNSWSVMGDPTQLHQVFLNLCVNARDAMPDGGGLTIKLENVMLDEAAISGNPDAKLGAYVAVQVADTGCGIARKCATGFLNHFSPRKPWAKGRA